MFIHYLFIFFNITMNFGFWVVTLQIVQYLKQKTIRSLERFVPNPALFNIHILNITHHEAT